MRIDSVENMASFQDSWWASSVRNGGNNTAKLKKINFSYGHGYPGKTILSRIFRTLETGSISDRYTTKFQLSFDEASNIKQNPLSIHGQVVRVFNKDFLKDNLRFIADDERAFNSFAILGRDNIKLEKEIEKHETELGNKEDKSSLIGGLLEKENDPDWYSALPQSINVAKEPVKESQTAVVSQ